MDVRLFSSFAELPPEANLLFSAAGNQCFFSSLPWFNTFVDYGLESDDDVRIYWTSSACGNEGQSCALAMVHRTADSRFWKPRKLCSLSSYYTCLFAPIWNRSASQPSAEKLARAIAADSLVWDEIEVRPLDPESPTFTALVLGLKSAGFVVQTYFCFGNWYLPVGNRSFAKYLESLPSAVKNTLDRKKRKLERFGGTKIEIVTGGEGLEAAIEAYNAVYQASWKQPEPFPHFVPELIRTCAKLGSLRLGIIYVREKPAAAQFWIVHDGKALIYKLAYDEQFTDLSVGTILTATLMQHVIDVDLVKEVDYLSGDDTYKKNWMSHRRERWGILAMNPRTMRGALGIARHVGGRAIKRLLQFLVNNGRGEQKRHAKVNAARAVGQ